MTEQEVEITAENFDQYFFDVRKNRPKRGQVMARYAAVAEFLDGQLKKDIVDLIYNKDRPETATRVMRKLGCATERDAIRICKEIAYDLAQGLTPQQVEQKVYKYVLEVFYYTEKQNIPIDDPHWSVIGLNNLDEFLDAADNRIKMKVKLADE